MPGPTGIECLQACAIFHHYGRHSHEAYAIGVIEAGVGGNDYRGSAHYLPAGGIVVMNPDEVHTGYTVGDQPLSYRMLYPHSELLRGMLPERANLPYFRETYIRDENWARRLRRLHRLLETPIDTLEQQTYLIETLTTFASVYGATQASVTPGREPKAVKQVKEFLRANSQQNIRIDDLVQLTHLNRAYLIRTFRLAVGMPPHAYLLQVRIERAKQLLSQGMSIAQVAYEVGFADQSHLTRRFKSLTGITPKQYTTGHFRSRHSPGYQSIIASKAESV